MKHNTVDRECPRLRRRWTHDQRASGGSVALDAHTPAL